MVDENRVEGTVKNLGGKVQDVVGGLTGDTETKARGKVNQAAGSAQDTYGSALDTVGEWSESIVGMTKDRPLTALLFAVSIGYMIRMLTHSGRR